MLGTHVAKRTGGNVSRSPLYSRQCCRGGEHYIPPKVTPPPRLEVCSACESIPKRYDGESAPEFLRAREGSLGTICSGRHHISTRINARQTRNALRAKRAGRDARIDQCSSLHSEPNSKRISWKRGHARSRALSGKCFEKQIWHPGSRISKASRAW
jgi:hypothetical protein